MSRQTHDFVSGSVVNQGSISKLELNHPFKMGWSQMISLMKLKRDLQGLSLYQPITPTAPVSGPHYWHICCEMNIP